LQKFPIASAVPSAALTLLQTSNEMTTTRSLKVSLFASGIAITYCHAINHWSLEASSSESVDCSDCSIADADSTFLVDEPSADAEFFEEPKRKGKGALIGLMTETVIRKEGTEGGVMRELEDDAVNQWKGYPSKSEQVPPYFHSELL
jgi:hypothetical protein